MHLGKPELSEHIVPGHIGQVQIQQDEIMAVKFPEVHALFADDDVQTWNFSASSISLNTLRDDRVVLNQQDVHWTVFRVGGSFLTTA